MGDGIGQAISHHIAQGETQTVTTTIRNLSWRQKIASAALALALIGSGFASFAALSDTLVQTNQYAVLSINLQASNHGVTPTFTESITTQWQLANTTQVRRIIQLKNAGNGAATVTFNATGTGSASITGALFRVYVAPTAADCGATNTDSPTANATLLNPGGGQTVGAATYSGTGLSIAAGAVAFICETVQPSVAPADADTANQTVTWSAQGAL